MMIKQKSALKKWLGLVLLTTLLTACLVELFTLLSIFTPNHPLDRNEVAFVEFEFEATDGSVDYANTAIVVQVPDNWLVLEGFLGETVDRPEYLQKMNRIALDPATLPTPEAEMQLVAFQNVFEGSFDSQIANRGVLSFIPDGVTVTATNIKAIYGEFAGDQFSLIAPPAISDDDFANVALPDLNPSADLVYSGAEMTTAPVPLEVEHLPTPFANEFRLRVLPQEGFAGVANQYAYRVFVAADVPGVIDANTFSGDTASPLPVELSGESQVDLVSSPGQGVFAEVIVDVDEFETDEDLERPYYFDVPVYTDPALVGSQMLYVFMFQIPGNINLHVTAVALVANQSAPDTVDFEANGFVNALNPATSISGVVRPGSTGIDDPVDVGILFFERDGEAIDFHVTEVDGDGNFPYELTDILRPNTTYSVFNFRDGESYEVTPNTITTGEPLSLGISDLTLGVALHQPVDVLATGTITGSIQRDGVGIAGVPVYASSSDLNDDGSGEFFDSRLGGEPEFTDSDGNYSLAVRPGANYRVHMGGQYLDSGSGQNLTSSELPVRAYYNGPDGIAGVTSSNLTSPGNYAYRFFSGSPDVEYADLISVTDEGTVSLPTVSLGAFHQVSGQVVDDALIPIAGMGIFAFGESGFFSAGGTDEDGNYAFSVPEDDEFRVTAGRCVRDSEGTCTEEFPVVYYSGAAGGLAANTYDNNNGFFEDATTLIASAAIPFVNMQLTRGYTVSGAAIPGLTGISDENEVGQLVFQSLQEEIWEWNFFPEVSGHFPFEAVTLRANTSYTVYNYRDGQRFEVTPGEITTGNPGGTEVVDFTLSDDIFLPVDPGATATIAGVVEQDGVGLEGVPVYAVSNDLNDNGIWESGEDRFDSRIFGQPVFTDANGEYSLAAKPGSNYQINLGGGYWDAATGETVISAEFPIRAYYNGPNGIAGVTTTNLTSVGNNTYSSWQGTSEEEFADRIAVNDGGTVTLAAVIPGIFHQVYGQIVDESANPISGIDVNASGDIGFYSADRSDEQGQYALYVPANEEFRIESGGCAFDAEWTCVEEYPQIYYSEDAAGLAPSVFDANYGFREDATTLIAAADIFHVNLQLITGFSVSGVVDPGTTGISDRDQIGALIFGTPNQSRWHYVDEPDASGNFPYAASALRPNTDYSVSSRRNGEEYEVVPNEITTGDPGGAAIIDFTLTDEIFLPVDPDATATITGRIVRDGVGIAGIPVYARSSDLDDDGTNYESDDDSFDSRIRGTPALTDENGDFSLAVKPGANYRIHMGGEYRESGATALAPELPINVYYNGPNGIVGVTTSNVTSAGNYAFSTWEGAADGEFADRITVADSEIVGLDTVVLGEFYSVSGQIVDQSFNPIAGIEVNAQGDAGFYTWGRTDALGDYQVFVPGDRDFRITTGGCVYDEAGNCVQEYPRTYYSETAAGLAPNVFDSNNGFYSDATILVANADIIQVNLQLTAAFAIFGVLDPGDTGITDPAEAGALVFESLDGNFWHYLQEVDGEGNFPYEESGLRPNTSYSVYNYRDGDEYAVVPNVITTGDPGDSTLVDFLMSSGAYLPVEPLATASIFGTVEQDGTAIEGIPVYAWSSDLNDNGTTDSNDDRFSSEIRGQPAFTDENGDFSLAVKPGANYRINIGGEYWDSGAESWVVSPELPVRVYYNGPNGIGGVTTNNANNSGNYTTRYSGSRSDTEYADLITATDGGSVTLATVTVAPFYRVTGQVVDDASNPIAGIYANAYGENGFSSWDLTDELGLFELYASADDEFRVSTGGCVYDAEWNCVQEFPDVYYTGDANGLAANVYDSSNGSYSNATVFMVSANTLHVNLQLTTGFTLSGTVLIDGVAPGSDARYWVSSYDPDSSSGGDYVDPDTGAFEISNRLPGDEYRSYVYELRDDVWTFRGYYQEGNPAGTRSWNDATLVSITGDIAGIDFDLLGPNSLGTVSGTVTFPADVLSGLTVWAWSETERGEGQYFEIEAGQTSVDYSIGSLTPSDDYYVEAYPEGGLQTAYYAGSGDGSVDATTQDYWDRSNLEVIAGTDLSGIDLDIPLGETIFGTLSVSGDPGCDAGCGIWVSAYSFSESSWAGTWVEVTSSGGVGSVDYAITGMQPASDYRLSADAWNTNLISQYYAGSADGSISGQSSSYNDATLLDPSDQGLLLNGANIALGTGNTLSGNFNLPAPAASSDYFYISVYSNDAGYWGSDSVFVGSGDTSVPYSIPVEPAQNYRVWVSAGNYAVSAPNPLPTELDLRTSQVLNINLEAGRTISGVARDDAGEVVPRVSFSATPVASSTAAVTRWGYSDRDGEYQIEGLKAGVDYLLRAFPDDFARSEMNDKDDDGVVDSLIDSVVTDGDFGAGSDFTTASFVLSKGITMAGTVQGPDGSLLRNAYVHVYANGLGFGSWTENDGSFTIYGLEAATDYSTYLYHPDFGSYFAGSFASGSSGLNLFYPNGSSVSGSVSIFGGSNVDDGYITVFRDDGDNVFEPDTDDAFVSNHWLESNGEFHMPLLEANNTYFFEPRVFDHELDELNTDDAADGAVRIEMVESDLTGINIFVSEITDNIYAITGKVTNPSTIGNIDRVEVVALEGGATISTEVVTIGDEFLLEDLEQISYRIRAYAYDNAGTIVGVAEVLDEAAALSPDYDADEAAGTANAGEMPLATP